MLLNKEADRTLSHSTIDIIIAPTLYIISLKVMVMYM